MPVSITSIKASGELEVLAIRVGTTVHLFEEGMIHLPNLGEALREIVEITNGLTLSSAELRGSLRQQVAGKKKLVSIKLAKGLSDSRVVNFFREVLGFITKGGLGPSPLVVPRDRRAKHQTRTKKAGGGLDGGVGRRPQLVGV